MAQNHLIQIFLLRRKLQREQKKTEQLEQELWDTRQELEFQLTIVDGSDAASTQPRRVRFQSTASSLALSDVGDGEGEDDRLSSLQLRGFSRFSRSSSTLGLRRSGSTLRRSSSRRTSNKTRNSSSFLDPTATDEIFRLEAENEDLRSRIFELESGREEEDDETEEASSG